MSDPVKRYSKAILSQAKEVRYLTEAICGAVDKATAEWLPKAILANANLICDNIRKVTRTQQQSLRVAYTCEIKSAANFLKGQAHISTSLTDIEQEYANLWEAAIIKFRMLYIQWTHALRSRELQS